MSLSDKIGISGLGIYKGGGSELAYGLKVEDVREAVRELKKLVDRGKDNQKPIPVKVASALFTRWIDEIFGEKLI